MQDHLQPYLQRIEELQNDTFAVSKKLPPLNAWQEECSSRIVVAAPSKKRAMELAQISQYDMETYWEQCSGSWWYHLAYEEGVWCEERGDNGSGTGIYYRPISKVEADEIAAQHLNQYRVMPIDRLIRIAGQEVVETGESSTGTPYRFTAEIRIYDGRPEQIIVIGEVNDLLGWSAIDHRWFERAAEVDRWLFCKSRLVRASIRLLNSCCNHHFTEVLTNPTKTPRISTRDAGYSMGVI